MRNPQANGPPPELAVGDVVTLFEGRSRGVVRFHGRVSFSTGLFVGVELDQPTGMNDGSVRGQTYFTCEPGHGIFVRPHAVVKIQDGPGIPGKVDADRFDKVAYNERTRATPSHPQSSNALAVPSSEPFSHRMDAKRPPQINTYQSSQPRAAHSAQSNSIYGPTSNFWNESPTSRDRDVCDRPAESGGGSSLAEIEQHRREREQRRINLEREQAQAARQQESSSSLWGAVSSENVGHFGRPDLDDDYMCPPPPPKAVPPPGQTTSGNAKQIESRYDQLNNHVQTKGFMYADF